MAHPQEFDEVYRLMEKIKILLPLDNEEAINKAFQEHQYSDAMLAYD